MPEQKRGKFKKKLNGHNKSVRREFQFSFSFSN